MDYTENLPEPDVTLSPIEEALTALHMTYTFLRQDITELARTLKPVLQPEQAMPSEPDAETSEKARDVAPISPVLDQVRLQDRLLETLRQEVRGMAQRADTRKPAPHEVPETGVSQAWSNR